MIVYGVEIPGTDGRAGMAAIGNEDGHVDMCRVSRAALSLPSYARPIFVRLLRTSADSHMTGRVILKNSLMAEQSSDKKLLLLIRIQFLRGGAEYCASSTE